MRQAGILAAAGLIALNEMTLRLAEDHANARFMAEGLSRLPRIAIDPSTVQTNIVIFQLRGEGDAAELVSRLKTRGLLVGTVGPHAVRLVTHRDVDREDCELGLEVLGEELRKN